jgi:hypothetical protein
MTAIREGTMAMTSREAGETLKALERLICAAELMALANPAQRAALQALRGRRAALRRLLSARRKLRAQKIVCIGAWSDDPAARAARPAWGSAIPR